MDERQHRNLEYVLLILVIALAGIAYYFGYLRYLGEAEQANNERRRIEAQIEEIAEKKRLQEFFKDEITESKQEIAEIADKFTRNEILSSNEIRQIIGMKPSDDPKADELINSNLNHNENEMPAGEEEYEQSIDENKEE